MRIWQRLGRAIDGFLGGAGSVPEVNSSRVDQAIRLIQDTIDEQQRVRRVQRVRVSDLDAERKERLTRQLRQLLAENQRT